MKDMSHEVCVFGGCYFASEYVIYIVSGLVQMLSQYIPQYSETINKSLDTISELFFAAFVFLLFRYLFTAKSLLWVQKIIREFPKISVYLYYLGLVGYFIMPINVLLLAPAFLTELSETVQISLIWVLLAVNGLGLLIPLILATKTVFFKQKN